MPAVPETVLVAGASSQLGVFLLPRLQQSGFRVLALSRDAPQPPADVSPSVRWIRPSFEAVAAVHLVSCGPLGLAHSLVERCGKLQRLIAFSSSSVLTKGASENRNESRLMARICADEQRLRGLCEARGIALTLIRPTLIYGCGLDRNISLLARFGRRFGFIPVASKAEGLRQPVHADDLAAMAVRGLLSEIPIRLESAACGGSTLGFREMMEKTAAACGSGVRVVRLDTRILMAAVMLGSLLPGFKGINTEMVKRQGRDMVFDDSLLREALAYQPRSFNPSPADFEIPGYAADLQLPR